MNRIEMIRTLNIRGCVGELGERIAQEVLGGDLCPRNTPGIDLILEDGRTVQVKCQIINPNNGGQPGTVNLGVNRIPDLWVIIRVTEDWNIGEGWVVPGCEIPDGPRVSLRLLRELPGVRNISSELQERMEM